MAMLNNKMVYIIHMTYTNILVNLPRNLQELKSSPAVLQRLEEAMKVLENEEPANKAKGLRRLGLKIGGFHGISWGLPLKKWDLMGVNRSKH
jgi:hypothetical protein